MRYDLIARLLYDIHIQMSLQNLKGLLQMGATQTRSQKPRIAGAEFNFTNVAGLLCSPQIPLALGRAAA